MASADFPSGRGKEKKEVAPLGKGRGVCRRARAPPIHSQKNAKRGKREGGYEILISRRERRRDPRLPSRGEKKRKRERGKMSSGREGKKGKPRNQKKK